MSSFIFRVVVYLCDSFTGEQLCDVSALYLPALRIGLRRSRDVAPARGGGAAPGHFSLERYVVPTYLPTYYVSICNFVLCLYVSVCVRRLCESTTTLTIQLISAQRRPHRWNDVYVIWDTMWGATRGGGGGAGRGRGRRERCLLAAVLL